MLAMLLDKSSNAIKHHDRSPIALSFPPAHT